MQMVLAGENIWTPGKAGSKHAAARLQPPEAERYLDLRRYMDKRGILADDMSILSAT